MLDRPAWHVECPHFLLCAACQALTHAGVYRSHKDTTKCPVTATFVLHHATFESTCLYRHQELPQPAQSSALRRRPSPMATLPQSCMSLSLGLHQVRSSSWLLYCYLLPVRNCRCRSESCAFPVSWHAQSQSVQRACCLLPAHM